MRAPRGTVWSASTLNGNASRGHGILVNPIYGGQNVWNRVRMIKDPDTGRRVSRNNDPANWVTNPAPHLAIVSAEVFEAAQARRLGRAKGPHAMQRKPKHLFSGLLKCGCCGGGLSVKDRSHGRTRLICTRSKESGSCSNARHLYLDQIEERVFSGLRNSLGSRSAIDGFLEEYGAERRRLAGHRAGELERLEGRLASIDADLDRATTLLIKGILDEEKGAAQIAALKNEQSTLLAERTRIAQAEPDLTIHPVVAQNYLASLHSLEAALRGPPGPAEAEEFAVIRNLVQSITLTPIGDITPKIEVEGDLAHFLAPPAPVVGGEVVAEEGTAPHLPKSPDLLGLYVPNVDPCVPPVCSAVITFADWREPRTANNPTIGVPWLPALSQVAPMSGLSLKRTIG